MSLERHLQILGVRQLDVATALGVAPETVSRWVTGEQKPRAEYIGRILSFLNTPERVEKRGSAVTFEELFSEEAAA